MTKHFFKTLLLFTGMIALGLTGIFLASYFGTGEQNEQNSANVAK